MKLWIALALTLATSPALARNEGTFQNIPFPEKTIGPWDIYATEHDCWMKRVAPNGNEFMLSTAADDTDLYVVMRKKAWTFIKEDAELPMRVQFTGTDTTGNGSGSLGQGDLTPGVVMYLRDRSRDYLADLHRSPVIRTWLSGKPALVVNMTGSKAALDYFAQCTAVIRKKR